jgi:hypothetical protein
MKVIVAVVLLIASDAALTVGPTYRQVVSDGQPCGYAVAQGFDSFQQGATCMYESTMPGLSRAWMTSFGFALFLMLTGVGEVLTNRRRKDSTASP